MRECCVSGSKVPDKTAFFENLAAAMLSAIAKAVEQKKALFATVQDN